MMTRFVLTLLIGLVVSMGAVVSGVEPVLAKNWNLSKEEKAKKENEVTQRASSSNSNNSFSNQPDQAVCVSATTRQNGELQWDYRFPQNIRKAKRRGLTCGVNGTTQTASSSYSSDDNFAGLSDSAVCRYATYDNSWETRHYYKRHVKEAKRRGLTCGVNGTTQTASTSSYSLDGNAVCVSATTRQNGELQWDYRFPQNIRKAKRRGLSCGVASAGILPKVSPEEQYRFSLGRALANDLVTAESALSEFRKVNRGHERFADATFWLGRVQFMRGEYEKAAMTFSEFNSAFPKDPRLVDTTLWIAESVSHFAPREQACEIYASLPKLLDNPPNSFMTQLGALASAAKCGETAIASSKRTPKQTRIKNAPSFEDNRSLIEKNRLSKINDEDICEYASYLTGTAGEYVSNWSVVEYSQQYVREAKRRGLSCGVGQKISGTQTASTAALEIWKARTTCSELGFTRGTRKHDNCVLQLSGKSTLNTNSKKDIFGVDSNDLIEAFLGTTVPNSFASSRSNLSTQTASAPTLKAKPKVTSAALTASEKEAERLRQELAALKAEKAKQQQTISNDTQVPLITITQSGADGRKGSVKGYAKDNVQLAEVLIDGQAVRLGNDGSFEWSGFVPATGKEITIEAIDTAALSSTKTVSLKRGQIQQASGPTFDVLDPTAGKKVKRNSNALALIVGISDYERTDAPAVYADKDAQYFHDYASLKLGIPDSNIKTMVNAKAEQGDVILAVKDWMRRSSKPGKTDVYVFFAGHGLASQDGEQMYLLPYDGRPRLLDKTAILREELFDDIASANPRSVTVFLDTCYSGTTRGTDMLIASRPIAIKALEQSVPDNFTVMTAAAGDQTAKPLEEARHGMFSYFLMKGMEGEADKNQDNKITAGELHSYVQQNVVQQSSGSQTPELQGDKNRVLVQFQ